MPLKLPKHEENEAYRSSSGYSEKPLPKAPSKPSKWKKTKATEQPRVCRGTLQNMKKTKPAERPRVCRKTFSRNLPNYKSVVGRIPAKATEGTPQKAPQKAKSVVDRIPAKATEGTPQKAPQKAKSVVDRIPAKAKGHGRHPTEGAPRG